MLIYLDWEVIENIFIKKNLVTTPCIKWGMVQIKCHTVNNKTIILMLRRFIMWGVTYV